MLEYIHEHSTAFWIIAYLCVGALLSVLGERERVEQGKSSPGFLIELIAFTLWPTILAVAFVAGFRAQWRKQRPRR